MTGFGQQYGMGFFIFGEITRHLDHALAVRRLFANLQCQQRRQGIHLAVHLSVIFCLTRDDERRTRLIDQNRVNLIDNSERKPTLHALGWRVHHVVAQVIEAEFIVGAVRDVSGVGCLLHIMRGLRQVNAGGQAEPAIQHAHPLGIALREVIIHRHHMHAVARQCVQVGG